MVRYASLRRRAAAYVIDTCIVMVIMAVVILPFGSAILEWQAMTVGIVTLLVSAILFNLWVMYFTYFEFSNRQTPGKRVMGIMVVKEDGSHLSLTEALLRNIIRFVDDMPVLHIVGMTSYLMSRKKQRLGDIAASTIVVDKVELPLPAPP